MRFAAHSSTSISMCFKHYRVNWKADLPHKSGSCKKFGHSLLACTPNVRAQMSMSRSTSMYAGLHLFPGCFRQCIKLGHEQILVLIFEVAVVSAQPSHAALERDLQLCHLCCSLHSLPPHPQSACLALLIDCMRTAATCLHTQWLCPL